MNRLFFLSMLITAYFTAIAVQARCPNPQLQSNFDINQYLGKWYEIMRTKNMPFEWGICSQANYSLNPKKAGHVIVVNSEMRDGTLATATADAVCGENGDSPAHCSVTFQWPFSGDYRVLETDYKTYTVVYSCSDLFFTKAQYAWILSREQKLDDSILERLVSDLQKLGFSLEDFQSTPQVC